MRDLKITPLELGRRHAQELIECGVKATSSRNPFAAATEEWSQYNRAFNRTARPELFSKQELAAVRPVIRVSRPRKQESSLFGALSCAAALGALVGAVLHRLATPIIDSLVVGFNVLSACR